MLPCAVRSELAVIKFPLTFPLISYATKVLGVPFTVALTVRVSFVVDPN